MKFCRSIYVKKVVKLLAFIFEQPSITVVIAEHHGHIPEQFLNGYFSTKVASQLAESDPNPFMDSDTFVDKKTRQYVSVMVSNRPAFV